MTHDKLTVLASLAALSGLLSLSAVVGGGRRPLPPQISAPPEAMQSNLAALRESITAEGLLPVEPPSTLLPQPEAPPAKQASEAPPVKVAIEAVLNLHGVGTCLDHALTDTDLRAARECIEQQLADRTPTPQELGHWICGQEAGRHTQAQVMIEVVLGGLPGEQVLDFAEQVIGSCPTLVQSDLIARAALATRGAWKQSLGEQLSPALLFNPLTSTLALELTQRLALEGDAAARALIEAGASGIHGGSEDQLLGAARLGLELQVDAGESLGFLTGLVESQLTPGGQAMGSFLAESLWEPTHWEADDPSTAVALLNRIIDDERFRLSAGRSLSGRLSKAPLGVSERAWAKLQESPSFQHLLQQVLMVAPD